MKKLLASLIILVMLGGVFVSGLAHASAAAVACSVFLGGNPGGSPEPPLGMF